MRLTSAPIINFSNINDFQLAGGQWTIRATDPQTLYFQLFDLDNVDTVPYSAPYNFGFFGINQTIPQRFIAGVGVSNQPVTMVVTFPSLNAGGTLNFTATQDPYDGSVFSIYLPGYTNVGSAPASGNVTFTLTMGLNTYTWTVQNMIAVENTNTGCC
jgi:hypothetical protein